MSVVTRFAPSPTGYLHIGGARTALFNWLFAKKMGGTFLLRIEDTDRARSTPEAIEAILEGMAWLGLKHDGQTIYQFARAERHRQAAEEMIARGTAFRCYVTQEELEQDRATASELTDRIRHLRNRLVHGMPDDPINLEVDLAGIDISTEFGELSPAEMHSRGLLSLWATAKLQQLNPAFRSPYRDGKTPPAPDAPFTVRLRAPDDGEVVNADLIQGDVRIKARDIDDLVLLRADGNPTYMLAVVVDDHDMGITHVIRGDDHLTNAARQIVIYRAMDWIPPLFAHVPLIHGEDGKKLSKRHGAQAVDEWRDLGYLPEAMDSYLMRLGWSPGHDDILTKEEAIPQFEIGQIGKAPARLDFKKLDSVNAHFLSLADDARVTRLVEEHMKARGDAPLSGDSAAALARATPVLKKRAKTIPELAEQARFVLAKRPLTLDDTAKKLLNDDFKPRLSRLRDALQKEPTWDHVSLGSALKAFATSEGVGLGQIGPGLRAALTGGAPSPDLGQTLELLGRDEALARIADQV
ncbi:MAG: glutamate--tRNA ligase [Hyphomonadaceae bacterium]|nr:glutamate--tRNA ligase [Hyphomonadaceae bacterium]